MTKTSRRLINQIKNGGLGVMPTDTIYGLVGQALNKKTVEKIYRIKKRRPNKPLIILIADISNLEKFKIRLSPTKKKQLKKFWPGPVSIIFPVTDKKFAHLHRGRGSLAFRLPRRCWLRQLIAETGPLVAPSANPEDQPPAKTIAQAKEYFGRTVDFYSKAGHKLSGQPSRLIKLGSSNKIIVLRS